MTFSPKENIIMPSQSAMSSLAFSSGSIFTASVGYVFARSSKQKRSSRVSLSSTVSSTSIPEQRKPPPFSPSALKTSFQRFKLFRLKSRQKPRAVFPDQLVIDDDISSICSDSTGVYTITTSSPNLPGTLPQAWESSTSTNGFSPRSISEMIEEEEEWFNSDEECVEPRRTRDSLPITSPIPKKKHRRGFSLPPPDLANNSLLYHHQRPSECWDDEFPLEEDLVVPDSLKETQFSLRLDIYTIRDFIHQIETLKVLRDRKLKLSAIVQSKVNRKWKHGFAGSKFKRYSELEKKFGLDWEKTDVIIDLSDVAQDKQPSFGGGKSVDLDIERVPSERHMQVLKIMMEDTNLISVDERENRCDCYRRLHCKKHKDYSDHDHNPKKQKLTNGNSANRGGDPVKKKRKENFRIDVEMMPNLVEHLKDLQKSLSGHVDELESLATLIALTGGL